MKKLILIILVIYSSNIYCQTICEGEVVAFTSTFNICETDPWALVFEENFNGSNLDLSRWSFGNGFRIRYCNNEQQYYTSGDNIEISNGTIKLIAKKETVNKRAVDWLPDNEQLYCDDQYRGQNLRYFYYTSANIETIKRFSYGKFEARVKIAKGKGFWPAFWVYQGDPKYNEIDIFEFWNEKDIFGNYNPSKLSKVHHMNIHFDFGGNGTILHCGSHYNGDDFSQDFHIFTSIWDEHKIQYYVDGDLKRTDYKYYYINGQNVGCTIGGLGQYYIQNKVFPEDPMQIILNFAIQSGSESPESSTTFPSQMEVDWVRYYQRNPCRIIIINDASQYPLNDHLFNAIVGEDVIFNCNYTIHSGQQLDVIANSSIILDHEFSAELGSTFNARFEPNWCESVLKNANSEYNIQDSIIKVKNGNIETKNKNSSNNDINIFPIPNNGGFAVDFGSIEFNDFSIIIKDIDGKSVYSLRELNSNKININLSDKPKGLYILYLFNNQDKNVTTYKIIVQ